MNGKKVEELRARLVSAEFKAMEDAASYARDMDCWNGNEPTRKEAEEVVDSFIFAVEERTREKIRRAGVPVSNVTFSLDGKVMKIESDGRDKMPSYFVPASAVLAKEAR